MFVPFNKEFAAQDHTENLPQQLGIPAWRAQFLKEGADEYIAKFMTQDLQQSVHYPIAQVYADVLKKAETLNEAIYLSSRTAKVMAETLRMYRDADQFAGKASSN